MAAPARDPRSTKGIERASHPIGGYQHEGHSFVPGVLTLADMAVSGYVVEGPKMLTTAIGDDHEVSGAIDVARAGGVELIPTAHAWGGVGPAIEDVAYRFFEDRILAGLRAERGRIDGVYLPLHGASITTASEDPEGDLLTAVRDEVGPDMPVVASFDLHAHTTRRIIAAADAILPYRTCPHTDFRATGQRAMTLLLDAVAGRARPIDETTKAAADGVGREARHESRTDGRRDVPGAGDGVAAGDPRRWRHADPALARPVRARLVHDRRRRRRRGPRAGHRRRACLDDLGTARVVSRRQGPGRGRGRDCAGRPGWSGDPRRRAPTPRALAASGTATTSSSSSFDAAMPLTRSSPSRIRSQRAPRSRPVWAHRFGVTLGGAFMPGLLYAGRARGDA